MIELPQETIPTTGSTVVSRRYVLLFGPPAAGKDTITEALAASDSRFVMFEKLKVGSGRRHGHRIAELRQVQALQDSGSVLSSLSRYGNSYFVDSVEMARLLELDKIPVIHTASVEEFLILSSETMESRLKASCVGILLWNSVSEATKRLIARDPGQVEARMDVWFDVRAELLAKPISVHDEWETDSVAVKESAARIRKVTLTPPQSRHLATTHRGSRFDDKEASREP